MVEKIWGISNIVGTMELDNYIRDIFIPISRACAKIEDSSESSISWYLWHKIYDHACRALEEYGKFYVSKAALNEYRKSFPGKNISQYDKLGKKFHYEHVFTIKMLRKMLSDKSLNLKRVRRIIKTHYCTAWIQAKENKTLNSNGYKSDRGSTLNDALKIYRKMGIELINKRGNIVN